MVGSVTVTDLEGEAGAAMEAAPVAVAYLRVSTAGQAEHGYGLEAQRHQIAAWCAEHGYRLEGVWSDEGVSGTVPPEARDAWPEMMAAAPEGATIVVAALDRLAREMIAQERTLQLVSGAGLHLESVKETGWGTAANTDATRVLIRQILGALAQYERDVLTARMTRGKARKVASGGFGGGRTPFGWRNENGTLVEDPAEQRVVAELRRLRGLGWSANRIAREMQTRGIPTKMGGKWAARTVIETLRYCDETRPAAMAVGMKVEQRPARV